MQFQSIKYVMFFAAMAFTFSFVTSAEAHDVFKAPMQERFNLKTVSCSACHPGKEKSVHNKFGAMFVKAFKGKDLTKKLEEAEAKGGEKGKEEFEAEMVEHFKKALKDLEKKEPLMIAIVDAGLLVGTKKTPEGLETAQEDVVEFIEADADTPIFEGSRGGGDDADKDADADAKK